MSPITRGVRNNNPGNIDHNDSNKWVGELPVDKKIESRFCRFDTPENGIRALCKLLLTYQRKHGIKTVSGLISRWAPSGENDTAAYIQSVAKSARVQPLDVIDLSNRPIMAGIVKAIIKHENAGYEYPDGVLYEGVTRGIS